jgi:type IV pilus assembly protein PilZ
MASDKQRDDGDPRDRREHERTPIELKVEYKRLNAFFADYTRNISKGGTFIQTGKPLPIGTRFVFRLFVPKLDDPLEIQGEVKWVVTPEDLDKSDVARQMEEGEPGMGIRFIYADDSERAHIESAVEGLMVDNLGPLLATKLMSPHPDEDNE